MVNTIQVLTEKNKELLAKIEELEKEKQRALRGKELKEEFFSESLRVIADNEAKIAEHVLKIGVLEKDLEEKSYYIAEQKEQIAAAKLDAEVHLEALDKAEQWKFKQLAQKLVSLNYARNMTIEYGLQQLKFKDCDLEKASEKIKTLENFVAWQQYVADKQFQKLPTKPNKFKTISKRAKSKINEAKEAVKEKFNAYILQKNK